MLASARNLRPFGRTSLIEAGGSLKCLAIFFSIVSTSASVLAARPTRAVLDFGADLASFTVFFVGIEQSPVGCNVVGARSIQETLDSVTP